jgi:hypothetical protein
MHKRMRLISSKYVICQQKAFRALKLKALENEELRFINNVYILYRSRR